MSTDKAELPVLKSSQYRLPVQIEAEIERRRVFEKIVEGNKNLRIRHNVHSVGGHSDWIKDIVLTPDGKQILSGSKDSTIKKWHVLL